MGADRPVERLVPSIAERDVMLPAQSDNDESQRGVKKREDCQIRECEPGKRQALAFPCGLP